VHVVQGRKVLLLRGIEHVAVGRTAGLGRHSPITPLLRLIHVANASQQARGLVTRCRVSAGRLPSASQSLSGYLLYGTQRTVPWGRCPGCWRTASPAHADFGGLSSGAAPVVVQLDVVPLPPRSSAPTVAGCRLGGYPVGRDRWDGKRAAGGMSEDYDKCFSMLVLGAFSTGVFQTPMH
jgi:hypothetical protein